MKGDIMKRYALIIIILLTVMFLSTAGKETKKQTQERLQYSTTVQLEVAGEGKVGEETKYGDMKNNVYSYVSRELRALGDVQVVKNEADWIIYILPIQIKNPQGYHYLFSLSTTIVKPFHWP